MKHIHINFDYIKPVKIISISTKINIFYKEKRFLKYCLKLNIFFALNYFLNKLNINKLLFFNIIFTFFKTVYNLYMKSFDIELYYKLLKLILKKYEDFLNIYLNNNKNILIYNNNYIFYPNSILVNLNFKLSNENNYSSNYLSSVEKYFFKKLLILKKQKILKITKDVLVKNKYYKDIFLEYNFNFSNSKFNLKFLRIQRRYNKRRYSKVRVSSRNSFFAGISLSSLFLAILWGGSIKKTDWLTSKIIIIDINLFIFITFLYFIYRLFIIFYPSIFIRKKNKIKILNTVQKLFIINVWFKK